MSEVGWPAWDWSQFQGSSEGLKWNRKEIPVLMHVLRMVEGREAVVQAGGNLGIFPKYLSRHFQTVYTFEPEPELFECLCYNAPERNIVKLQAAVGFERKPVFMSRQRRQKDGGNSHEGITHVSGDGPIPQLWIDDLGLRVCDLLYLDIEGYELYALKGASTLLERCRPVIVCEVNKSLEQMGGITRADIHSLLAEFNYRFVEKVRSDEIFVPA